MIKYLGLVIIGMAISLSSLAQSLYVFVPTETRANIMQSQINELCPDVEVVVFGRAKDFHNKIEESPPDAILSLLPVVERTENYSGLLQGVKGNEITEEYVLVSVDTPVKTSEVGGKKIGVVDLLGRKPMKEFIDGIFKTEVKIKRVTKVEDLLPLITFGAVDAVFVSDSIFNKLKSKSNLNLVATKADIKIGLASTALNDPGSKDQLKKCIMAFDSSLNNVLGVDLWRAL